MIEYNQEFIDLWAIYPKRLPNNSKAKAFKAYKARIKQGYEHSAILAGLNRYRACKAAQNTIGTEYIMLAATFFGPDEHFLEEWQAPEKKIKESLAEKAKRLEIEPKRGESQFEFDRRIQSA